MITYLQGELVEKHPTRVVLDVGGVGYEVFIPLSSYDGLPTLGDNCRILVYDYVREDNHQLFGFMTEDERKMFVLLMSITRIGPKLALSVLSGLAVRELKMAVVVGDVKRLSSISGVGKKVAERLILELKDKISEGEAFEAMARVEKLSGEESIMRDAIMALISLGYKQDAARKMVDGVLKKAKGTELTVEDVIKKALGG